MLTRSADLFRRARQWRKESERFTEPTIFRQLSGRWASATREAARTEPPAQTRKVDGLPRYWQKSNRRADDFSRTDE